MKYFITGATGFIGGRLAKRLVSGGYTINAKVRRELGYIPWPLKEGLTETQLAMMDEMKIREGQKL